MFMKGFVHFPGGKLILMGDYGPALTNACLKIYNLKMGLLCIDNLGFDSSPIELNSEGKHRQLVI